MEKRHRKNKGGYAMLFTVVVVSAISVITAGLTNIAYKQLTLFSLAKDSQTATIWADTANECALFFEQVAIKHLLGQESPENSWICGGINFEIDWGDMDDLESYESGNYNYELSAQDDQPKQPCFEFSVESVQDESQVKNVTIKSSGFNICDKGNIRAVERSYRINYNGEYAPSY